MTSGCAHPGRVWVRGQSAGRSDSCASREPPLQDWPDNWQPRGTPCGPTSSPVYKPHLMTLPVSRGVRVLGVDEHEWHHQDRRRRGPRQGVLIRVQDGLIGEPVAPEMLSSAGMKPRRHGSIRALPRESRQNGSQSPPRRRVPSTPPMSVRPDAPSQRRQAPSPPEDAPGVEPATQPGHTHAQPHQPTPESAHQSQKLREEDDHS